MTFEVQELPMFSIKRFNLQNVLNFKNTRSIGVRECIFLEMQKIFAQI